MRYTVIDFETANNKRSSACALGLVVVSDSQVLEEKSWLIKPSDMYFSSMNMAIHGIGPEDVIDADEFDVLYNNELKPYLEGQMVVAHNASFDMSVLRACLKEYGITWPNLEYLCTVKLAQKVWPNLPNHRLNTVSDYLAFDFKHHDAYDDARACANIVREACQKLNIYDLNDLTRHCGIRLGRLYQNGYDACSSRRR